jgi:hypothetical protein
LDLLLQCYDRSQKSNSAYRGGNDETLGRHATLQLVALVWDGVAGAPVASLAQSRGSRRSSMLSRGRVCAANARAVFADDIKSLARGAGIEDTGTALRNVPRKPQWGHVLKTPRPVVRYCC